MTLAQAAKAVVELHRLGGLVGIGTDFPVDGIPPGTSVHRELELLVQYGKATPSEALQMATSSSARILGFDELLGSVAAGKLAHFAILKANPLDSISNLRQIEAVVHDGRLRRVEPREPRRAKK